MVKKCTHKLLPRPFLSLLSVAPMTNQAPQQPAPQPKGMSTAFKVLLTIIGLIVFAFGSCAVCMNAGSKRMAENRRDADSDRIEKAHQDDNARAAAKPLLATTLLSAYQANEVQADALYKGQYFAVSGIVDSISKSIGDTIYIKIGTGAQYDAHSVHCMPSGELARKAATLSKGQSIVATGRVDGMVVGQVTLRDCTF